MINKEDILVEVKGVSKKFNRSLKRSMWYGLKDMGSALLGINGNQSALREGEFWAVKDVSFSLRRGECLGLIGHNGAGKSTLLKMLNGLIRPDEGSITMHGKIGALIELGAGFNPLLTGRENIYVNGQLLGFSRKEIKKNFDAIIDFADIGEFIDSPVQNYSSGMKVRLGFAVAVQMEPDILIIDEVLAVGDVGFRSKCYNAISKIQKKAGIILVTHAMPILGRIADRTILMKNGKEEFHGNVPKGVQMYYGLFPKEESILLETNARLTFFELKNKENIITNKFSYNDSLKMTFSLDFFGTDIREFIVNVAFITQEQQLIAQAISKLDNHIFVNKNNQLEKFNLIIPNLNLSAGVYYLSFLIFGPDKFKHLLWYQNFKKIEIINSEILNSPIIFEMKY